MKTWTLIPLSALYGVAAVLIFRRFTEQRSIRKSLNRILAHVMELGLFFESPALVLRAQRDLLRENFRLLRLVLIPGAILAAVFTLLFPALDAIYGRAPLPVGEPAVVTIQMKSANMLDVQLEAPSGLLVETPPVHVPRERQISWRVRPLRENWGDLKFHPAGSFDVEIPYPRAHILGFSWLVWFVLISSGSAALFGLCWKR